MWARLEQTSSCISLVDGKSCDRGVTLPQKGPEELIITAQTGNSVALLPKYRDPVAPEMSLLASRGEQISCKSSRWGCQGPEGILDAAVCGDRAQLRNVQNSTHKAFIFPRNLPPKDLISEFMCVHTKGGMFSFSTTC